MRPSLPALLIALAPGIFAANSFAEEQTDRVLVIEDALFTQQTELDGLEKQVSEKQAEIERHKSESQRLLDQANELNAKLAKVKQQLAQDYEKLIIQPDFDISASQMAYQDAWADVKTNQEQRLVADHQAQELAAELSQIQGAFNAAQSKQSQLKDDRQRARVERLRGELNQDGNQTVSFTNVCQDNMTLAQCKKQTTTLALQKAVNQFQAELISGTTEQNIVEKNLTNASLNIHVLKHQVTDSGFYDGIRYRTVTEVALDARPAENAACKMLAIDSSYCFAPGDGTQAQPQKEVAWVNLTVRSNQYNDKVLVDGVNYGSTPVEIMLPTGTHQITVEKEGFKSFNNSLAISGDHTLRAVLVERANLPQAGEKFADKLNKQQQAPEMTVLGAGQFLIGENASQQFAMSKPIAMSSTPVTVSQFEQFVKATDYQTDAELKKVCVALENTAITPISGNNWRQPGFEQQTNSPAVCISQTDAKAYTNWLSSVTGYQYRLPTESEWEVAARAGSAELYWWGNEFKPNSANTGWSGSKWSNSSTSPVKSFAPNPYGLFDMIGNVWEWTASQQGIAKGGAWSFSPQKAAAQERLYMSPSTAANFVGFRVVREL